MKFSIAQLRKSALHEAFTFDETVDVSELEEMNNDIRKTEPMHVAGRSYVQGEQFIFDFHIHGKVILPCARTLIDVPYTIDVRTSEVFALSDQADEENEIHPIVGEVIDLSPYIKEHIILNIPFRVYSEDALDPESTVNKGQGWELIAEEDKKANKIDPRLKKLESLLKENKSDREE
ncbi:YceD family protein [Virgibacillus kimchii]